MFLVRWRLGQRALSTAQGTKHIGLAVAVAVAGEGDARVGFLAGVRASGLFRAPGEKQ
jgi:hypothetical protein